MYSRSITLLKGLQVTQILAKAKISAFGSIEGKTLNSVFFHHDIQKLLLQMTPINVEKVLKARKLGQKLKEPRHIFMTDEDLAKAFKVAEIKAQKLMQIPPVIEERHEINEVLEVNEVLDGHDSHDSRIIFGDISLGEKFRHRLIVVREPNGILRKAMWKERHRMNEIIAPTEGRKLYTPKMFQDENINRLLDEKEYIFILDRACIQFEPDDPVYQKYVSDTYKKINENRDFGALDSTRHFGALAFYLVVNRNIQNLLLYNIGLERMNIAAKLITLYCMVHELELPEKNKGEIEFVKEFIKSMDGNGELVVALQSYIEEQKAKEEMNLQERSASEI